MTTEAPPAPLRMRPIDRQVIAHTIAHPARGYPWTYRELAEVLGCSAGTISHLVTGSRASVPTELAHRFSEAVGCETAVLFVPAVSTESNDGSAA